MGKFVKPWAQKHHSAKAPKTILHTAAEVEEGRASPDTLVKVQPESAPSSPKNENSIMAWAQSFYAPAKTGGKTRRQRKRKTRRTQKHRKRRET
jgi:hypothetical protein